ncbi:MAG: asparaginase domain-containing protein [Candidatus Promineifilaceae bacterium]|jgi:L-asparaginase
MSIRIIVTGGTFDKRYDEIEGTLTFHETHLPDIMRQVRVTIPVEVETNQLIDSLHMTTQDRLRILEACRLAPESQLIVTHGTDTIVETARLLGEAHLPKTIVLTGAMVPYTVYGSDSLFNLGSSFTAVQMLPHGVYIVMNGRVFDWDNVQKDRGKGVFELLKPD